MTNRPDAVMSPSVDTRDMIVVHTALLREVRRAPAAVHRASARRALRGRRRTARHLRLVLDILEHHHAGEDELLLPLLRARVPGAALHAVDAGEEQHARIERLLADVRAGLEDWSGGRDVVADLAAGLTALHAALEPHLRAEESEVLPLAARYLSAAEWEAIGEAGSRSVPKSALLLVFGMFMDEGDPAVLRAMLAPAPPPVRLLVPRLAPRVYARRARQVHGTTSGHVGGTS